MFPRSQSGPVRAAAGSPPPQTRRSWERGCPGAIGAGSEENGAERALSQRQSRARGRDGAFLSELRGDRERKDPDRNVQRRTTREAAPDVECLLHGLWQRAFPGEMRPMANPARHASEATTHAEIRGIPLPVGTRAPECQRPVQRLERPGGANPGHGEQRWAARPAPLEEPIHEDSSASGSHHRRAH